MTKKRFEFREATLTGMKLPYVYDKSMQDYLNPLMCVDLLNELDEDFDDALNTISRIQEENQDLVTKKEDLEYELLHLKEKYEELLEDNEQLRIEKSNTQTMHSYELMKKLEYKLKLIDLKKENEQLKSKINMLKTTICRNEEYINRLIHKSKWRC